MGYDPYPYNFDGFQELLKRAYTLGWYSGCPELIKITMEGGFEAFSGRASEGWEHRFIVETQEVKSSSSGYVIWPGIKIIGKRHETLSVLCKRILAQWPTGGDA